MRRHASSSHGRTEDIADKTGGVKESRNINPSVLKRKAILKELRYAYDTNYVNHKSIASDAKWQ